MSSDLSAPRLPQGPQTPYEVYCYRCHTSFPVGTRRCVHCGGPVGQRAQARELRPRLPELHDEDLGEAVAGRRLAGMGLWILLAIGATLYRVCAGG